MHDEKSILEKRLLSFILFMNEEKGRKPVTIRRERILTLKKSPRAFFRRFIVGLIIERVLYMRRTYPPQSHHALFFVIINTLIGFLSSFLKGRELFSV